MLTVHLIATPSRLAATLALSIVCVSAAESHAAELCGVTRVQSGEGGFAITLQGWNQGAHFAIYRADDKERASPIRVSPLQGKLVLHEGELAAFSIRIHGACLVKPEQRNGRFGVEVDVVEHSNGEERRASTFVFADAE